MTDILWLGALAGLFALSLAYVHLCDTTSKSGA
jgi:hypothetical protein